MDFAEKEVKKAGGGFEKYDDDSEVLHEEIKRLQKKDRAENRVFTKELMKLKRERGERERERRERERRIWRSRGKSRSSMMGWGRRNWN